MADFDYGDWEISGSSEDDITNQTNLEESSSDDWENMYDDDGEDKEEKAARLAQEEKQRLEEEKRAARKAAKPLTFKKRGPQVDDPSVAGLTEEEIKKQVEQAEMEMIQDMFDGGDGLDAALALEEDRTEDVVVVTEDPFDFDPKTKEDYFTYADQVSKYFVEKHATNQFFLDFVKELNKNFCGEFSADDVQVLIKSLNIVHKDKLKKQRGKRGRGKKKAGAKISVARGNNYGSEYDDFM
eukprot:TRINITY_DN10197_c0_g1_i1.p1 TRINITY_DN10197_c0_g1~~TRINITY_DN10197_c0_g1_i1.p1  ORF type:complete len:240 (+),score=85.57 TRINITY_DN10197_c0_g1_i1:55-774(+)